MSRLPMVAIVGRPNVGKSSLFNRLAGNRIAIEDPRPGTTRDRVSFHLRLKDRLVELVDAAGIGVIDEQQLEEHIEEQIEFALEQADLLLFVVDCKAGLMPLDRRVADTLRRLEKPLIVVANKADAPTQDHLAAEFHQLGLSDPLPFSCKELRNIDFLREAIHGALPDRSDAEDAKPPVMHLAIVGKRNSGKSSLVNFLADSDRCIVSEIPGTTRDSIDVHFKYKGMEFVAIDTAGIQRERSVANSVEFFSQARSIKALRRCNVIILLMDCIEESSKLDRDVIKEAMFELKPVVVGVNKWDMAGEVTTDRYLEYLNKKQAMIRFAPKVFLSVKEGRNCFELVDIALELHKQTHMRVTTGELNRVVRAAFDQHKPRGKFGKPPKLFYPTCIGVAPIEIVCFVNDAAIFNDRWREYLKDRLRKELPFSEVPIKLVFKTRERVVLSNLKSGG